MWHAKGKIKMHIRLQGEVQMKVICWKTFE